MATAFNTRKRIRRFFGHIESVAPMPNLIEVQKSSYETFLQRMIPAAKRTQSAEPQANGRRRHSRRWRSRRMVIMGPQLAVPPQGMVMVCSAGTNSKPRSPG